MAAGPGTPLASVDVLGEAERARVLDHWNSTAAEIGDTRRTSPSRGRRPVPVRRGARRPRTAADLRRAGPAGRRPRRRPARPRDGPRARRRHPPAPDRRAADQRPRGAEGGRRVRGPRPRPPRRQAGVHPRGLPGRPAPHRAPVRRPAARRAAGPAVRGRGARTARPGRGRHPVDPRQLCYVTYTSGSTGRPKGIAMPHAAVANLIGWELAESVEGGAARTFCYASLSFDVSFQEMFTTWSTGGTLVLVGPDERVDFERLVDLARAARVERWYLPAFALEQVAAAAARKRTALPDLRALIAGSEPLHVTDELRRLLEHTDGGKLENQYGPSECHVVTSHTERAPVAAIPDRPPIGRPLANTRVYLLDDDLRPVPVGVTGTLHLAGAGVARGYLGRPASRPTGSCPAPSAPPRRAHVRHRRPRTPPPGRLPGVPRPRRQPGQDPWLPGRTR
ncbi:AMP-binding protein [Streptomyces sp. M19]